MYKKGRTLTIPQSGRVVISFQDFVKDIGDIVIGGYEAILTIEQDGKVCHLINNESVAIKVDSELLHLKLHPVEATISYDLKSLLLTMGIGLQTPQESSTSDHTHVLSPENPYEENLEDCNDSLDLLGNH